MNMWTCRFELCWTTIRAHGSSILTTLSCVWIPFQALLRSYWTSDLQLKYLHVHTAIKLTVDPYKSFWNKDFWTLIWVSWFPFHILCNIETQVMIMSLPTIPRITWMRIQPLKTMVYNGNLWRLFTMKYVLCKQHYNNDGTSFEKKLLRDFLTHNTKSILQVSSCYVKSSKFSCDTLPIFQTMLTTCWPV